MERHEVELLKQERKEEKFSELLESYRKHMIADIADGLMNSGSIMDILNTLDLDFDDLESLEDTYINECIMEAAKQILKEKND